MQQVETVLARARAAKELGRFEDARRILGEALVADPDDPALLEQLADVSYELDRFADALRYAGQAIAIDPDLAGPHVTVALVYDVIGRADDAERHARIAVRLAPDHPSGLFALAVVLVRPRRKRAYEEVRSLLERVAAAAHGDPAALALIAGVHLRMADIDAARRHIDAGLRADPTHADLLALRARIETGRGKAVSILRGLLGAQPGHPGARRQLAAITWRAMMRLAAWLWFFVGVVVAASLWIPADRLRVVSTAAFVVIPFAWFGVFRTLRRQLPPEYLMRRLRGPAPIAALVVLVVAALFAEIGVVLLRLDWTADSVRGGYTLLLAASCAAGLAHLLFFLSWLRRGAERDTDESGTHAFVHGIVVLALGIPLLGVLFAVRRWAHQPAACSVLVALLSILALVFALEATVATVLETPARARWVPVAVMSVPIALAAAGFWWGAHGMADRPFRSEERLPRPTFPEIHYEPLPPIPTFTVPTLLPPPTGAR